MIENTLFNIPVWSLPTLNFKKKKPQLEKLCKAFPERKHGIQTFSRYTITRYMVSVL